MEKEQCRLEQIKDLLKNATGNTARVALINNYNKSEGYNQMIYVWSLTPHSVIYSLTTNSSKTIFYLCAIGVINNDKKTQHKKPVLDRYVHKELKISAKLNNEQILKIMKYYRRHLKEYKEFQLSENDNKLD